MLDQLIGMVERREIDVDMSVSVAGLHSLQSAFSTLLEGNQHKQVISLTDVDDEQLIKVCALNTFRDRVAFNHHLDTTEDFSFQSTQDIHHHRRSWWLRTRNCGVDGQLWRSEPHSGHQLGFEGLGVW